jgi:hypothetical protein
MAVLRLVAVGREQVAAKAESPPGAVNTARKGVQGRLCFLVGGARALVLRGLRQCRVAARAVTDARKGC